MGCRRWEPSVLPNKKSVIPVARNNAPFIHSVFDGMGKLLNALPHNISDNLFQIESAGSNKISFVVDFYRILTFYKVLTRLPAAANI